MHFLPNGPVSRQTLPMRRLSRWAEYSDALQRGLWGGGLGSAENTELDHPIQQAHALIMGDMLLRLVLLDIGQGEIGWDGGHGSRPFAR